MSDMEEDAGSRAGEDAASAASGSEDAPGPTMVLSRARRANAGNRMSSLIALAEADDQERVIYGDASWDETADDLEFGGADAVAPDDVSLVSSSDNDEDDDDDDDEAGEKEIKKLERLEKTKKRKELANPFANRKKGKLAAAPIFAPQPRPKKKSERDSWIPIQDDGPTRASSRRQTMKNKEDTHARLLQKEKTREKVVRLMEAANKRKEHLKANPLSQAEKMAMAARVEKENSKSLNRWEEAENRRAEEQQARLDALRNRKLEGPFIRYWSAQAIWKDDKLVTTEKKAKLISEVEETIPTIQPNPMTEPTTTADIPVQLPNHPSIPPVAPPQLPITQVETTQFPSVNLPESGNSPSVLTTVEVTTTPLQGDTPMKDADISGSHNESPPIPLPTEEPQLDPSQQSPIAPPPDPSAANSSVEAPAVPYPSSIMFAPPPLASGFLDGILDWASYQEQPESVLAPAPVPGLPPVQPASTESFGTIQTDYTPVVPVAVQLPPLPLPPKPKPVIRRAARNLITLSHFDELTAAQKERVFKVFLQPAAKPSRYLTSRAHKHNIPPQILCAITAQPARYRDPATGLPYRDKYAYKCIQRLVGGSCQWSSLLQCYVGPSYGHLGGRPAAGVPERFFKNIPKPPQVSPRPLSAAPDVVADTVPSEAPIKNEETVGS